jgi:hypothetical protein
MTIAKKKPIFAIKPTFDKPLVACEAALAALGGIVICVFLLATFVFIIFNIIGLGSIAGSGLYHLFFFIGLIASPVLYFELKRTAYRRTVYLFYDDYMEYQDFRFLLTRRRGRLRYEEISDVYENAGMMQSRRLLTTVYVVVPGMPTGMARNTPGAFNGVKIPDVPENGGYADRIIAIVQAYMQGGIVPQSPATQPPGGASFQQPAFQAEDTQAAPLDMN